VDTGADLALLVAGLAAAASVVSAVASARSARAAARAIDTTVAVHQRTELLSAASDLIGRLQAYETMASRLAWQQMTEGPPPREAVRQLDDAATPLLAGITRLRLIIGNDELGDWILDWTRHWIVEVSQAEETEQHIERLAREEGEEWQMLGLIKGYERTTFGESPAPDTFQSVSIWAESYRASSLEPAKRNIFSRSSPLRGQAAAFLRDYADTYLIPWLHDRLGSVDA